MGHVAQEVYFPNLGTKQGRFPIDFEYHMSSSLNLEGSHVSSWEPIPTCVCDLFFVKSWDTLGSLRYVLESGSCHFIFELVPRSQPRTESAFESRQSEENPPSPMWVSQGPLEKREAEAKWICSLLWSSDVFFRTQALQLSELWTPGTESEIPWILRLLVCAHEPCAWDPMHTFASIWRKARASVGSCPLQLTLCWSLWHRSSLFELGSHICLARLEASYPAPALLRAGILGMCMTSDTQLVRWVLRS